MNAALSKIGRHILYFFLLSPFLFPTGIIKTNIQPYAMVLSCIYVFLHFRQILHTKVSYSLIVLIFTFLTSVFILFLNPIDMNALRGFSNYISICFIPLATYFLLKNNNRIDERFVKNIILLWFLVGFIQLFFRRDFMTSIIGGVRWSSYYRGVVGMASEPSFYGIACYFFLFLTKHFKTKKWYYYTIILIMGILFAQSAMGIIFIGSFLIVDIIDQIRTPKGYKILFGIVGIVIIMFFIIQMFYSNSRMYLLIDSMINFGIDSLYQDESATNRMNAISNSLMQSFDNYFLPYGFQERIGSGFGAILNELGIFGIGLIFIIPLQLSKVFMMKLTRIVSFITILLLLFSNTQLANPIMSFVIGVNMYYDRYSPNKVNKITTY